MGLELPPDQHEPITKYLASNGDAKARQALLDTQHWTSGRDGRASIAYPDLIDQLRVLRQHSQALTVFCLYEDLKNIPGIRHRADQIMADRIRKEHTSRPDALILTFTGNFHSKLKLPEWLAKIRTPDGQSLPKPMGEALADLHPISIDLDASGGAAWNCQQSGCGVHEIPALSHAPASLSLTIDEAQDIESYTAQINVGKVTASAPAVEKFK